MLQIPVTFTLFKITKIIKLIKIIKTIKWMTLEPFLPDQPASQPSSQPASQPALSSELSSEVASSGRSAFAGWLLRSFSSGKTTPLPRNKDEWSKKSFCFLLKFDEIADSSGFWVLKNLVWVPLLNGR